MNEDNRELEQMKSEIRLEMKEIRRMLEEIKSNTAYFREFMEKYNIPMQEEVAKEQKEVTTTYGHANTCITSIINVWCFLEQVLVPKFGTKENGCKFQNKQGYEE